MADRLLPAVRNASLPGPGPISWHDRMVLQFRLQRRSDPPVPSAGPHDDADPAPAADGQDGAHDEAAAQDPGSGTAADLPARDPQVIDLTDGARADAPAPGDAAAAAPPPSAPRPRRTWPRPGRSERFGALVGVAQLRADLGPGLSPVASVAAATAWLIGWMAACCALLALVAGFISQGPLLQPFLFVDAVRLAHLMPVGTAAGTVSLLPMGPALVVLVLLLHAGGWLWRRLRRGQETAALPIAGVAAMGAGYFLAAALIATSPTPGVRDGPLTQGWLALLLLVLAGTGLTIARQVVAPGYPRVWLLFRAAGSVLAVLLAVSLLLLLLRLLAQWPQFWAMSTALLASGSEPASRFDAAALGALQLAYLPNAVVWTAAYLVGVGFSVGAASAVSPFSVTVGTLPELPLTALLPAGPLGWPWLPPLLVAASSLLAGAVIRNTGLARRMRARIVVAVALALLSGIGMGLLAAASNGGLGPGRLALVGPGPWITGAATAAVVGFGQLAWALFPTLIADLGPFVQHGRGSLQRLWARSGRLPAPALRRRGRSRRPARAPAGAADGREGRSRDLA